jgi:hypothetical protein
VPPHAAQDFAAVKGMRPHDVGQFAGRDEGFVIPEIRSLIIMIRPAR